jgi:hypothetical protein
MATEVVHHHLEQSQLVVVVALDVNQVQVTMLLVVLHEWMVEMEQLVVVAEVPQTTGMPITMAQEARDLLSR